MTGVPVSSPKSMVSSSENRARIVCSIRPSATCLPSTLSVPVPPFPMPPPSYLKSNSIVCLPGSSGCGEEMRYLSCGWFEYADLALVVRKLASTFGQARTDGGVNPLRHGGIERIDVVLPRLHVENLQ